MPTIFTHPDTHQRFSVGGRRRPAPHAPMLRLANYLGASLPDPPRAMRYDPLGWNSVKHVYLNDELGDCVVAGAAHMIGIWTGNANGAPTLFNDDEVKIAYHHFSGGAYPAQDSGCDEEQALNFWAAKGFSPGAANPHRIAAWVSVNAADPHEVRTALWLFEGLMSGVELPDAWISPGPAGDGFTFDVAGAAVPENGHCMSMFSYDDLGIGTSTWGLYGMVTNAALERYFVPAVGGALYAAISQDALIRATQKAPNGFNFTQLVADARSIGFLHQWN